jgi:hypothetical protein
MTFLIRPGISFDGRQLQAAVSSAGPGSPRLIRPAKHHSVHPDLVSRPALRAVA